MTSFTRAASAGALSLLALCLAGCQAPTTVQWEASGQPYHVDPQHPWWHYQYVYHPRAQVYFEPYTETYYWNQDNAWRCGTQLPESMELDSMTCRVVKLTCSPPYMCHSSTVAMTGPRFGGYRSSDWSDPPMAVTAAIEHGGPGCD